MIFVSSGGLRNSSGYQAAMSFAESGLKNIELSGGAYDKDYLKNISSISTVCNFQIHNYFPPLNPHLFLILPVLMNPSQT